MVLNKTVFKVNFTMKLTLENTPHDISTDFLYVKTDRNYLLVKTFSCNHTKINDSNEENGIKQIL